MKNDVQKLNHKQRESRRLTCRMRYENNTTVLILIQLVAKLMNLNAQNVFSWFSAFALSACSYFTLLSVLLSFTTPWLLP